jgi:hypothetical protein
MRTSEQLIYILNLLRVSTSFGTDLVTPTGDTPFRPDSSYRCTLVHLLDVKNGGSIGMPLENILWLKSAGIVDSACAIQSM